MIIWDFSICRSQLGTRGSFQFRVWTNYQKIDMKEIDNTFYNDIRAILHQARTKAYSAVNSAMVEAYWSIGKRIVGEEQKGKERKGLTMGLILLKTYLSHLMLSLEKDFPLRT